VATRRIHPRRTRRPDEGQAVRRAGPRSDPLVLPGVHVRAAEERPRGRRDGLDPTLVKTSLGRPELHHPRDPKPVTERRAGHPLGRQVYGTVRHAVDRDRETVAAAGLHDRPNAEPPGQPTHPRARREDRGVELLDPADRHHTHAAAVLHDVEDLRTRAGRELAAAGDDLVG
jgi:hypothetical protein